VRSGHIAHNAAGRDYLFLSNPSRAVRSPDS
jgi:hypothetical protein